MLFFLVHFTRWTKTNFLYSRDWWWCDWKNDSEHTSQDNWFMSIDVVKFLQEPKGTNWMVLKYPSWMIWIPLKTLPLSYFLNHLEKSNISFTLLSKLYLQITSNLLETWISEKSKDTKLWICIYSLFQKKQFHCAKCGTLLRQSSQIGNYLT